LSSNTHGNYSSSLASACISLACSTIEQLSTFYSHTAAPCTTRYQHQKHKTERQVHPIILCLSCILCNYPRICYEEH
jgi:hypothetical protein